MAADLAFTPTAGWTCSCAGRAPVELRRVRLPERQLLFDLNDFDETLPGPFEYDIKRLAASFTVAARHNSFSTSETREVTRTVTQAYRGNGRFRHVCHLDVWYARMAEEDLISGIDEARRQAGRPPSARARSGSQRPR